MPGEVLLFSDNQGGNFKNPEEMEDSKRKLQEMADKLEKSEAGRKKLRQAISMLKEKLEATEKVLQVNDTLRQEFEKERQRAESEKKKAEEEKALRVQIEKENLSTKEQLIFVLQRLDAVEKNSKSDRAETLRVRDEMKQAISALNGALQVADAAHSSVQGLEKFVQDKVISSVSASTRALSLAQSVTSDVKAAQVAAASAEKTSQSLQSRVAILQKQNAGLDQRINLLQQETSKAFSLAQSVGSDAKAAQVAATSAEKLSHSLASRFAVVQKQNAGLDQRVNQIQQELRTRYMDIGPNFTGARTGNVAAPYMDKKVSNKGMVLSKSQSPSSLNIPGPPFRGSVVGSSDLNHDATGRETAVGSNGPRGQPKSLVLEPIQLVDSGSSSGCTTSVTRELELSAGDKVNSSTRVPSTATLTKRHSVTSASMITADSRLHKPANPPVSRSIKTNSARVVTGQENIQSASTEAHEALGRVDVDSTNGSVCVSGEHDESLLISTDVNIPQIVATTRRKVLSKKCATAGPVTPGFCGRQRVCGAASTDEKTLTLPLRTTEEGLNTFDVGQEKVVTGQRKVKLPAALLKDITKLFRKEKKVQSRMEAKFMVLERFFQSGRESVTFAEQIPTQKTRKRKRGDKVSSRKSDEVLSGKSGKNSNKKSRLDIGSHTGGTLSVEGCSGSLGNTASRMRSKDGLTGIPQTQLQSTPPMLSDNVIAEVSMTSKLQEESGKETARSHRRAVSSVLGPSAGERCRDNEQIRERMECGEENVCERVRWCGDVVIDKGGSDECTVTCSPCLPGISTRYADGNVHHMNVGKGSGKAEPDETVDGWDASSDYSDDGFDSEWWSTNRVLLSPTLPALRSRTLSEGTYSDIGPLRLEPTEMSLEDIALFLDVLPPISGEVCESEVNDAESKLLSIEPNLDKSSDNMEATASIAPNCEVVDILGEENAGHGTFRPEFLTSVISCSEWKPKMNGEDCGREEKEGSMWKIFIETEADSSHHKRDTDGALKDKGHSGLSILLPFVDSKLECHQTVASLDKEDKENMNEACTPSRSSVQFSGLRPGNSVLLPQETNIVSIKDSCANSRKLLNDGSGVEARIHQDVASPEEMLSVEVSSVDGRLRIERVNGTLRREEENLDRDASMDKGRVGLQPGDKVRLPPQETDTVFVAGSSPDLQSCRNSESGDGGTGVQDAKTQVDISTTVNRNLENPVMDGVLENEYGASMVRDDIASGDTLQVTGFRSSHPMLLTKETNFLSMTDNSASLLRSVNCESETETKGFEEPETSANTEDAHQRVPCEGEANINLLCRLKLLAGHLVDHKSVSCTEHSGNSGSQVKKVAHDIALVVNRTRDCLLQAFEDDSTRGVKSWAASSGLALNLAESRLSAMLAAPFNIFPAGNTKFLSPESTVELSCGDLGVASKFMTVQSDRNSSLTEMTTRLFGGNLLSIFTASLIDAYGSWESEASAAAPSLCEFLQNIALFVDEVFKAEDFQRTFPSGFQVLDVFAFQLQQFLIQGVIKPVARPDVEKAAWDLSEVFMFQVHPRTSDLERIRTVTSAGKLLASLCLGAGKFDYLRKSMYLILRYCNMDSSWLLAAISSFATVCGRQLFAAGVDDIAGQAVAVVISELLNDAEADTTGNEKGCRDFTSGIAHDACEESQEDKPDIRTRVEEVVPSDIFSTSLDILRCTVGKFEDNLNFDGLLPRIFQSFFEIISPEFINKLSAPQEFFSNPACSEPHDQNGTTFGDSGGAVASKVEGASRQAWQKVERKDVDRCCWQCNYSSNNGFEATSVKSRDTYVEGGNPWVAWELKFHEITHALEIVACHLGWEWTYNDLIAEHLCKRLYSGASDTMVTFVAKSLGIFGRLGIEIDGTEVQGVKELRSILVSVLEAGHKVAEVDEGTCAFSFTAQVAAAKSLLNLCRDVKKDSENNLASLSASLASILAWFQALDPASAESLPLSLKSRISSFDV